MLTVVAFFVALGLLVAVHEYGHYRVAVACGVKVLRFSVGFGKPIFSWRSPKSGTEFVIGLLPLGGYVRMLDEREAPVEPHERHLAFNTQPLRSRAAIVAAGPVANLLLAVVLYATVNWSGVEEPKAVLSSPVAGSVAQAAGLKGGELVRRAALDDDELTPVRSFEELRWLLTQAALDGMRVHLEVESKPGSSVRDVTLDLSALQVRDADAQLFRRIGIVAPWTSPVLGDVMPGGAAERSGLQRGDLVHRVGQTDVVDGLQLRELIRKSVLDDKDVAQTWLVERSGQMISVEVIPDVVREESGAVGRINAYVGGAPEMVEVQYGAFEGLAKGFERTWDVSALTLRMMGRMLIGEASLKNLSGPLTIADYAGRSAEMGLIQYLTYLALISVSLGVLNLLPLPVLDGGHLMYYLWEGVTGKGVSDTWMEYLQRGGVAVLALMMSVALFNDISRYLAKLLAVFA
ncbi:RIP metalloprotease RseP [Acidovorax sp. DW039]|uniref:RIP metalloprotease RseP n=1 Tax=Acidovorax sp. DW039 TaxID=3095606 RepID=UPI0030922720|nr:RIP metalloprotease RseP [Acidovorax sp. DW039]